MRIPARSCPSLVHWAAGAVLGAAVALASAAPIQDADPAQLLEDFVHYTRIAKADLAAAFGQELLTSGITNAELAMLVEESDLGLDRFDAAIGRALLVAELEPVAGEIARRVELGRLDLARDGQRIEQAIGMLTGTQRQKMLATGRLQAAGEYAVPALLKQITEGRDEKLKMASQNMLRAIGLQSVTPLSTALPVVDPQSQRIICEILGDVGYPHAAPYLLELSTDPAADGPAEQAADRAFRKLDVSDAGVSVLFSNLARRYYDGLGSLTAFPYEPENNVWSYDAFVGLVDTAVPTAIYDEIMAMTLAARALSHDPANRDALSLYVAANLKRENDLPSGSIDPVFGEMPHSPEFFATVFGTEVCLDILRIALDTNDTLLVRDAIAALSETTGGSNLFGEGGGRRPLIEALSYPDRRVQYEAALTLAMALPDAGFDGDYRVVPLLASAVRSADQALALVVADDAENRRQAVIALEGLTYTLAGAEADVFTLTGAIAEAAGIDVVVVRMTSAPEAARVISELRGVTKTAAAPILVLAPGVDVPQLNRDFSGDTQLKVARVGIGDAAFEAALNELLERAAGGRLTEAEADAYAFDALAALEDVSISCSPAYDIADAETALLDALESRSGRARLLVAEILSRIDSDTAQRRLFDAAFTATGGERIDLLDRAAGSVKRFGDRAQPRHVAALLDLIVNSSGSTAEAAARVHGSLNLSASEAVNLITEETQTP